MQPDTATAQHWRRRLIFSIVVRSSKAAEIVRAALSVFPNNLALSVTAHGSQSQGYDANYRPAGGFSKRLQARKHATLRASSNSDS
jgi:hypothetical protein